MSDKGSLLITVGGFDGPGIAATVFGALSELDVPVLDVEQVEVHGHLLLCIELDAVTGLPDDIAARLHQAVTLHTGLGGGLEVSIRRIADGSGRFRGDRQLVTVLAPDLASADLAAVFECIAANGGNVDRIARLSNYPVMSYELVISGAISGTLRRDLGELAVTHQVDVAVQRAGLHRRAKHLICMDADSTLLQGEVIDLLAARTDHADEVGAITAAAMAGELDFSQALRGRVALLEGLSTDVLAEVTSELVLTPGARTLIRTLRRLGYVTAVVSGGFVEVLGALVEDLGIDHLAANRLEIVEGHLTGRLTGPVVDRAGKAQALVGFAQESGVPLAQTVAVGDGANDLDMLGVAGLGIAFNAKPVVRGAADTALNVPYLDAILFLLGISREEVEAADRLADELSQP